MELIPIIFKILACCVILFLVVLLVSFLFSKTQKQDQINYKKIVEERKIAYSLQREQINSQIRDDYIYGGSPSFHQKVTSEIPSQRITSKHSGNAEAKSFVTGSGFEKKNVTPNNKPRYTVLNDTMVNEPLNKTGNKEVQIFYPINFQRTA